MKAQAEPQELNWKPVRRGEFYCSSACGGWKLGVCRWADYVRSKEIAEGLAQRLGAGWVAQVGENLGWHFSVQYRPDPEGPCHLTLKASHDALRTGQMEPYHVYLNLDLAGGSGGHFVTQGDTPEEAVQAALAVLERERERLVTIAQRLEGLGKRIRGDYPGGVVAVEQHGETRYFISYCTARTGKLEGVNTTADPAGGSRWNSPLEHAKIITRELGLKAWALPGLEEAKPKAPAFFVWVARCCDLLGWPKEHGERMLPAADPCWYGAFDDGLTPEQAVEKYRAAHGEDETNAA